MAFRSNGLLLILFLSCLFSCTSKLEEAQSGVESNGEDDSVAPANIVIWADSSSSAMTDSVYYEEHGEEAYDTYFFDTARTPTVLSFDSNEWSKTAGTLDYSEKKKVEKESTSPARPAPFNFTAAGKVIIVILVLGLLAFLIWRLLATPRVATEEENRFSLIFSSEHPDKMNAGELEELLNKYLEEGNYRFAIRILYLLRLKYFSDKDLIRWNRDKTNRHYIYELAGTSYHNDFSKLTFFYDTAWYGEHQVNVEQYEVVKSIADKLPGAENGSKSQNS